MKVHPAQIKLVAGKSTVTVIFVDPATENRYAFFKIEYVYFIVGKRHEGEDQQ
eukprot:SAG11_NODE_5009_length_1692_cov_2.854363_3_plen_53_part_00